MCTMTDLTEDLIEKWRSHKYTKNLLIKGGKEGNSIPQLFCLPLKTLPEAAGVHPPFLIVSVSLAAFVAKGLV